MNYIKKELYSYIGFIIFGCALLVASIFYKDNSVLFTLGSTFTIIGILGVLLFSKYRKSKEKCEQIEIMKTEERNVYIREKTNSKVYSLFVYIETLIVIFSGILGYTSISIIFSILIFMKLMAWCIICNTISKNS